MNKIPNRQVICEELMRAAAEDRDIAVLCSDSRGSASMTPFFNAFPDRSVEVGIAEQNLVSIAAGMAHLGRKAWCFSPACFLSARSYEQAKIDVAYSDTNVKLVGISGGISYGALGMSHHSCQDIAAMSALPNMRVYLPSDRFQTAKLVSVLLEDRRPAYIRVGRNPVEDIYTEDDCPFELNRAVRMEFGSGSRTAGLIACGEMVYPAVQAAKILAEKGLRAVVLDMYCVKPLDTAAVLALADEAEVLVTAEEHSPFGGLGSMVASAVSAGKPVKVLQMALPDDHVITGKSPEVFAYYGLTGEGIAAKALSALPS